MMTQDCPCGAHCIVEGCDKPHLARGLCGPHYMRARRHGDPLAGKKRSKLPPLYIEDVEWMAETGEGWENAARRLGYPPASLEKALEREGRSDLTSRLKRNRSAAWA